MKSKTHCGARLLGAGYAGSNPATPTIKKIRTSSEVRIFYVLSHF